MQQNFCQKLQTKRNTLCLSKCESDRFVIHAISRDSMWFASFVKCGIYSEVNIYILYTAVRIHVAASLKIQRFQII